ncbi:MAG: RDD family protein, partial [Ilumatobacteraceae bacterium]
STVPPPPAATAPTHDDDLAELLRQISDEDEQGAPAAAASAPRVGDALTKPTDVERPERAVAATVESEGGIDFDPEFASFGSRFLGLMIDTAVLVAAMLPGIVILVVGSGPLVLLGVALMIAAFCVITVLYARSVAATGQWIGNRMAATKVVDARNGHMIPVGSAGLRFVIRTLVSPILLIGFLVAFASSDRRTFHDNFAGSVVTRPPRERWSIDDEAPGV